MDGRPRRLHPSSPILDLVVSVRQWAFPLVILLVGGGSSAVTGVLAVVAVVLFVGYRVLAWRRFSYRIDHEALRIEHGVLNRRRREVPIRRIQQVDLQRKLRHRVLGVTIVRIDTAGGGGGAEVVLEAIADDDAMALRQALLGQRDRARGLAGTDAQPGNGGPGHPATQGTGSPDGATGTIGAAGTASAAPESAPPEVLVALTTRQLAVAGMTGSRLAAFLPFIGAGFGLIGELPGTFAEDTAGQVGALFSSAIIVAIGAILVVPLVLLAAAATSILTDHEFTLVRVGTDLHLRRGLLDQREATLSLQRIQLVRVFDNPVRRRLGLKSVQLQSAGSGSSADGSVSRLTIPYVASAQLDALLEQILPGSTPRADLVPAPPAARRRAYVRRVGVAALAVALLALVTWSWWGLVAAIVLIPLAILAELAYRGLGHAVTPNVVFARRGGLVRELSVVPVAKTQSTRLRSSPFQRRVALATLELGVGGQGRTPAIVDGERAKLDPIRHQALYARAARADEEAVRRRTRAAVVVSSDEDLTDGEPTGEPGDGASVDEQHAGRS